MDQEWFEMRAIRKRRLADAVWIPLRASVQVEQGTTGYVGYQAEFTGVGSVAIPLDRRHLAEHLDWSSVGLIREQNSYAFENSYKPADIFQENDEVDLGVSLVLDQGFDGAEPRIWHLHQDIVIALSLIREGDNWVCPREGYIDVAHLKRNPEGRPVLLEIRAEFLKDYLAARRMALRVSTYKSREEIVENVDHIQWPDGKLSEESDGLRFQASSWPIHEGGDPFGASAVVFHVSRTDVDPDVEIPVMKEGDDTNTKSQSWTIDYKGRMLYHIEGEFWLDEWVEPSSVSPRVRGDKVPSGYTFVVDSSGTRLPADDLNNEDIGKWLWFSPSVISAVSDRRGGSLQWYTRDTGGVEAVVGYHVHFGINSKDLITVYAHDVARLPAWQQRIWAGFNVSPDGGVSQELLEAQMKAEPAKTKAPEASLQVAFRRIDDAFKRSYGDFLFQDHVNRAQIERAIHRFRVVDAASLLALAKDIARLTADSFQLEVLHSVAPLAKGEKRGSLKSLERVVGTLVSAEDARWTLGPLVGIYDLRLGDAHMPSSKIDEAYQLAGVDQTLSPLKQAVQLISAAAQALNMISDIVERSGSKT